MLKLVVANKNYSSWSLRAWLILAQAEIPFEEERLSFNDPEFHALVRRYSPAAKVPVLVEEDDSAVWDSLAIAERLAERFPERRLWPSEAGARAHARSVCAEMHAGFPHLRAAMPMNCSARFPGLLLEKGVARDIARIFEIWSEARSRFGEEGRLLFGGFTIADAFFAPVVLRFQSYEVQAPPGARDYMDAVLALPALQRWLAEARAEDEFVEMDEPYREAPA